MYMLINFCALACLFRPVLSNIQYYFICMCAVSCCSYHGGVTFAIRDLQQNKTVNGSS